jgi:hypothetical protein
VNYFTYFTEIEEEFIRRRGSHLLVSPLDWSLIEAWKQRGIPLHIVLRGIDQSFDAHDKRMAQTRRGRKVNTLFYCRQEVEACYEDYLESRVGATAEPAAAETPSSQTEEQGAFFEFERVRDYLVEQVAIFERRTGEEPSGSPLHELLTRAIGRVQTLVEELQEARQISYEALEADLTRVEESLMTGLRAELPPPTLEQWEREGRQQLKPYRETMKPEIYQQTLDNYLVRRLREHFRIPRLSLFYLGL